MEKKKILIIDDEWADRQETYSEVLTTKYILDKIDNPENLFSEINQKHVDCYLIDVVLEKWKTQNGKSQELIPVLEEVRKKNKPVFLVSRQYKTLLDNSQFTPLLDEIIKKNICIESFFVWKDFEKEAHRKENQKEEIFTDSIGSLIELKILQMDEIISASEKKKADIGIICALAIELKPILNNLENRKKEKIDNISYTRGTITSKSGNKIKIIAVQQADMGTEDAAIISSVLTKEFNIKHLFMTGVCGGRDGKVNVGDIIIPNEVIAYQRGKFENGILEFDVGNEKSNINASQLFETGCNEILKEIFKSYSDASIENGKSLKIEIPKLHFNQMACGANVVDTPNVLDKIAKDVGKRKLCSVDMESFSIYRLNHFLDVNTLVIKSVMDLTKDKDDEYKEYAAYVSANFLIKVLEEEIYTI